MIGVHWSLALSALVLVAITCVLLWVGQGPAGSDGSCNQGGSELAEKGRTSGRSTWIHIFEEGDLAIAE